MKRVDALSGMRSLVPLLVFLADVAVAHHEIDEPDSLRLELNPLDYVPLAVGNRWTYEHSYSNETYPRQADLAFGKLEPFGILGYPHGRGNPIPPDSLRFVEKTLTIEITHTEVIDGLEYFVFSDADYTWPPLPALFWDGKKVRLSDEGFLVFRWNGQDVPVYDLDHHHFDEHGYNTRLGNSYTFTLPGESDMIKVNITRYTFFYSDGLATESPRPESRYSVVRFEYSQDRSYVLSFCFFLRGYGIGQLFTRLLGLWDVPLFLNILTPISANIDGEEILYPKHTLSAPVPRSISILDPIFFSEDFGGVYVFPDTTTSVQPTSWGQLKQSFPKRSSPSQDPP